MSGHAADPTGLRLSFPEIRTHDVPQELLTTYSQRLTLVVSWQNAAHGLRVVILRIHSA